MKEAGFDTVIINNNPETVSTDFDTSDRLYFEPLTPEEVGNVLEQEQPVGVVVQFGGQTAIKLAKAVEEMGFSIIGTPLISIDRAEDRKEFEALLENLDIRRPRAATVTNEQQAVDAAAALGYPVLVRPSYVLGGQGMEIAYSEDDIREYMRIIGRHEQEHPVLVDKYMTGLELEVDAICDGDDVLIPGIMEHIERAGVHSGDSISVYPAQRISDKQQDELIDITRRLALSLDVRGVVNIQYVISGGQIYVIEVNPRSSRTVPYISKVTGVPMISLAVRASLGEKLKDMGLWHRAVSKAPFHRRQGAGVLVREADRRGGEPGAGDEIHRRGAGHLGGLRRGALEGPHRVGTVAAEGEGRGAADGGGQ